MPFLMWFWRFYFPSPWSWFVTCVGLKKVVEVLHTSSKPRPHKALFVSMLSLLKPCHYYEVLASLLKAPTPWGAELSHPSQGRPRSATIQQTSRHEWTPPKTQKNCPIKTAKNSRRAQLICRLMSKKKCLLHATELLWLFNTQYYYSKQVSDTEDDDILFNSLTLNCY